MNQEFPKPPFWARMLMFIENRLDRARQALENTAEFLEWILVPAFGLLMRPFRWVMQSRVVELTERAQGAIERQASMLSLRVRDLLGGWLQRIFPRRLFWPVYWLFEQSYWFFDFFNAWVYTRQFRKLLGSIPAIAFSVPLAVVLLLGQAYSTQEKITHYDRARREALRQDDRPRADFLLARLRQLQFHRQDHADFERAMAFMKDEKHEESLAILHALAPVDAPKFAPAHLYLAVAMMEGELIKMDDPWPLIRTHARHAQVLEPESALAKRLIVEDQLRQGKLDTVLKDMEELRKDFPDLNAELAHVYAQRGDMPVARKFANGAVKYWERIQSQVQASGDIEEATATSGLLVTPQGYLRFAEAFGIAGDTEQELALLREGAMRFPDSPFNQQAYAARLTRELDYFSFEQSERREQLKDLLTTDPANEEAARVLFESLTQGNPEALQIANELMADVRTPAALHKLLGDMYLSTERMAEAKQAYQLACEKDPHSAYAWNNLAWIFSNEEPVDLERALQCTQRAIEAKQDPNFFETRGQILVKLERWEEAAGSLERALNGAIPNPQDAHRSLATIYTALGRPEQAAAHRAASGQ